MIRFNSRADRFQAEKKVFLRLWEELTQLRNERAKGFPGCQTCDPGHGACRSCVLDWEWAREIEAEIVSLERRVWQAASRESCPGGISESLNLAFEFAEAIEPR
jgi:hypothetical protein